MPLIGTVDEKGWHIDSKYFVYHPMKYGIATLMRIGFKINGWQLVLHHFTPHAEDEFHDHPWSFRTRVLWGGYVDETPCQQCGGGGLIGGFTTNPIRTFTKICDDCAGYGFRSEFLEAGDTRYRRAMHAHRTRTSQHTWTLVLMRPKERQWCKGTPQNWICGGKIEDFDALRGMVKVK